ncbi:MAG: CapA family protein, partial [Defluviitaleaceae bacterium]|nr:CapA family protein [Defluviitaleaceae bacterium]
MKRIKSGDPGVFSAGNLRAIAIIVIFSAFLLAGLNHLFAVPSLSTEADIAILDTVAETIEAETFYPTYIIEETEASSEEAVAFTAAVPTLPDIPPVLNIAPTPSPYTTITITAAGDTTLGGDSRWAGYHRFMREFENSGRDHAYFFRNVRDIFYESDLAIVNLEGTLTYAEEHMDKEFVFRGPPHFAQILTEGAVDVVTIANNHTIDFFDVGYRDTISALEAEDIAYFGNEFNIIIEVNGIYVGLFGFRIWNPYQYNRNRIVSAIEDLQSRGAQLIIAYHHWGYENVNTVNSVQRAIGQFTIDSGAHLVLGSHPHVIQGIEVYQGRNIVYSLANFCFGGNSNPPDQDTFIFQQTFTFRDGKLMDTNETNIIPAF